MDLKWVIHNQYNIEEVNQLCETLNVPQVIAKMLLARGIDSLERAKIFFKPTCDNLHDPFMMADMEVAVERLHEAVLNNQRIFIYGDYDVDGITSVSLLYLVLVQLGVQVSYYIPDRLTEGYGLSSIGIHEAHKRDTDLLITVDCGITGAPEIEQARGLGIDVIVCDHHEQGVELPPANAVLDPKRKDCPYPFKELAGIGVTYKLAQGLIRRLGLDSSLVDRYIDYVAIGSAADIVPLVGENRILTKLGLELLNNSDKVGIKALFKVSGLGGKKIGTGQIVFVIAPRINAVGRMGDAERAVQLLTTDNIQQAENIAAILETENRNRKNVDEETFRQAILQVEDEHDSESDCTLVLHKRSWHSGVIGIVASRIVEKYYRPTILISVEDGIGKGSARSIRGFDIYLALSECKDLLLGFGGHKYAAGLTIRENKIDEFKTRFEEVAASKLNKDLLTSKLHIDAELTLEEINGKLIKLLKHFAPFGPQNMRPVFMSKNLRVVGSPSIVGNNHLRFKVRRDGKAMDAIGFGMGNLIYRIAPDEANLDIAYVIDENEYMGQTSIQLRIKDLR
jgi:single-stranded-DNA-specific exonuclease